MIYNKILNLKLAIIKSARLMVFEKAQSMPKIQ